MMHLHFIEKYKTLSYKETFNTKTVFNQKYLIPYWNKWSSEEPQVLSTT